MSQRFNRNWSDKDCFWCWNEHLNLISIKFFTKYFFISNFRLVRRLTSIYWGIDSIFSGKILFLFYFRLFDFRIDGIDLFLKIKLKFSQYLLFFVRLSVWFFHVLHFQPMSLGIRSLNLGQLQEFGNFILNQFSRIIFRHIHTGVG